MISNEEYTGCIYANPCASKEEVTWRQDEAGRKFPWDLTRAEIAALDLKNLPIRLEHVEKNKSAYNNEVGRIIDVARDPETQYTAVKFKFHNTPAGHAAKALVDAGKVGELSLGHHYYPDTGHVQAREVSLCFKGARNDTKVYKKDDDTFHRLKMAENDAVIVPSAAPNNAATEPVKTPSAPTATEPTTLETPLLTHNARTSEAFLNIGGVANLQETVESLSKDIPLERRGEFFDLVGGLVYRSTDAFKRADEMEKRNKTFAEQRKTMEEYNKDLAKHLISVMVDLYENYNAGSTPVTDNLKKAAEKSLAENPMLLEFAKPITVCASAIRNRIEEHQRKQSDAMKKLERQCEAANDRIKEYTQLFGDLPKMIKTPIFETPAAEPVAPSAAPVVVCASQNQKKRARLIPDWLQQHCEEAGSAPHQLYARMKNTPCNHFAVLRTLVESDDQALVSTYLSRLEDGTDVFVAYTAEWSADMLDFLLECEQRFTKLCWSVCKNSTL